MPPSVNGGVTAQTLPSTVQLSDAPSNGEWAENTHWYLVKNGSGNYLGTTGSYVDDEGHLKLNVSTRPKNEGLWCVTGDETNGYTFYNYTAGTEKVLTMTGDSDGNSYGSMLTADESAAEETAVTSFTFTASDWNNGEGWWCIKAQGTEHRYLTQNGNTSQPNCNYLAFWDNEWAVVGWGGTGGDRGSCFQFEAAEIQTIPVQLSEAPSNGEWAENTHWYLVKNGNGNYLGTSEAYIDEVGHMKLDVSTQPGDNGLWCVTGDKTNGYVFYNKATGPEKVLTMTGANDDDSYGSMLTADESATEETAVTSFTFTPSNLNNGEGWWCIKAQGTEHRYFTQNGNEIQDNHNCLAFWDNEYAVIGWGGSGNGDNGSGFQFIDALGDLEDVYRAIETQPETGTYYRIKNSTRNLDVDNGNHSVGEGGLMAALTDGDASVNCHTILHDQAAGIWTFVATETEGTYKIYNPNAKKYLGKTDSEHDSYYVLLADEAEAGTYTLTATDDAKQFNITCTNAEGSQMTQLHASGSGVMNYNEATSANTPSAWLIVPATDFEVDMNQLDGVSWSTAYLPFAVQAASDTKAYTAVKKDEATLLAVEAEEGIVPAEEGMILKSETGEQTVTLSIVESTAQAVEGNVLKGTLTELGEIASDDYYIFGNGDNGLGFYHPNASTLRANRAYVPATAAQGVKALALDFTGGTVDGIGGVTIEAETVSDDAPLYDLSGRRVLRPSTGIYIKGGKKVFLK